MKTNNNEAALSPSQVGQRLGVSGQTVRNLCTAGQLRHWRVFPGGRFKIPESAVMEWLRKNEVRPDSPPPR